jgi:hypothetical protein
MMSIVENTLISKNLFSISFNVKLIDAPDKTSVTLNQLIHYFKIGALESSDTKYASRSRILYVRVSVSFDAFCRPDVLKILIDNSETRSSELYRITVMYKNGKANGFSETVASLSQVETLDINLAW